ncbi:unnamed protein product, partial [Brachionus calyciflorus]
MDTYLSWLWEQEHYQHDYDYEVTIINDQGFASAGIATKDCEKYGPVVMDKHGYSFVKIKELTSNVRELFNRVTNLEKRILETKIGAVNHNSTLQLTANDVDKLQILFDFLQEPMPKWCKRLKNKENNKEQFPPLLCELQDSEKVENILKKAKNLKRMNGFEQVQIKGDFTLDQRIKKSKSKNFKLKTKVSSPKLKPLSEENNDNFLTKNDSFAIKAHNCSTNQSPLKTELTFRHKTNTSINNNLEPFSELNENVLSKLEFPTNSTTNFTAILEAPTKVNSSVDIENSLLSLSPLPSSKENYTSNMVTSINWIKNSSSKLTPIPENKDNLKPKNDIYNLS